MIRVEVDWNGRTENYTADLHSVITPSDGDGFTEVEAVLILDCGSFETVALHQITRIETTYWPESPVK